MAFTNYQLYRTTPKLSGNMKTDLVVYDVGGKLYIKDFHIRPLSELISYNIIDEDILVRPHQLNIARFYSKTKGDFYTAKADPQLLSDWPIITSKTKQEDPSRIKNWDDTYWAGTQRMLYKLYGTTHELLIPVWLESLGGDISNLTIEVGLIPDGSTSPIVIKTLSFKDNTSNKFHNNFCKYLDNYFKYIGIAGDEETGNDKCLNINLTKNESYIYGLNVEDGNMQTRTDFNITRNLLYRERPLLESNSLLTNAFSDVHLILPQLINFNLCFSIDRWIPSAVRHMFTQTFYLEATVKVNGKALEKRDLYTNHQFVPRPINRDVITSEPEDDPHNALDYKFDYKCSDLMHKNKIAQPICHWMMSENQGIIFNLYDGFGASYKNQTINHFFGTVNDISNTVTDPLIPNTSPFGAKRIGDGDEVNYVLNHVEHYVYDEPYFIPLSEGWINSFRIQYEPDKNCPIQEILIAGMTTPFEHEYYWHKTSDTQTVTDTSYFAIWGARYNKDGIDTLPDETENDVWEIELQQRHNAWESERAAVEAAGEDVHAWEAEHPEPTIRDSADDPRSEHDKQYDVALYHDMDNRWGFGLGGPITSHRLEINSYGIYFCLKEIDWKGTYLENDTPKPAKALVVLIWDQQAECKEGINDDLIFKSKRSFQNIGFIIESLRRYIAYVEAYARNRGIDLTDHADYKLLEDLKLLDNAASKSTFPGVWYFNNTIMQKQDIAVSNGSDEIVYRKDQAKDAYVYRFDGLIKPAMYPLRLKKTTDFGMNYFWVKTFYDDDKYKDSYVRYAQTGVTPRYPSINYECINIDEDYGDILNPGKVYSRAQNFKEYKWFDLSKVVQYPVAITAEVDSESADHKKDLEIAVKNVIYNKLKEQIADELYDEHYIYSLYKINYELLRVKRATDNPSKLLYTYKITMKLK